MADGSCWSLKLLQIGLELSGFQKSLIVIPDICILSVVFVQKQTGCRNLFRLIDPFDAFPLLETIT